MLPQSKINNALLYTSCTARKNARIENQQLTAFKYTRFSFPQTQLYSKSHHATYLVIFNKKHIVKNSAVMHERKGSLLALPKVHVP